MSIRIRVVDGVTVALCAARSVPRDGDIYLDDAAHHALAEKFAEDFNAEGTFPRTFSLRDAELRLREESNNPNREWWDRTYKDPHDASCPASDAQAHSGQPWTCTCGADNRRPG